MNKIPSGTVTFLFTDIEGSTALWEQYPAQMRAAFARQEAIFRESVARYGGFPYKMIGDAFQVAFETASDALRAALEAQQRLQAEPWEAFHIPPVRLRTALHTGVTEERGDDYVGPALNRLGRLLGACHGGQIVLTQATCDLAQDSLPAGAALRDLGEHRFKDLVRAEHIYQLEFPGLVSEFPPLKSLDAFPHNLPNQLTSFIGREEEMGRVKRLLADGTVRLITLTGAGGTGKTRLALQIAADLLEAYPEGVWLVELAPLADPALVPQAAAAALGARESPGKPLTAVLIEHLRHKRALLILDNCEHVIESSARLADALLQACPRLQILATSREILGISGETPFRVPSLAVPDPRHLPPPRGLLEFEGVRLFMERAGQIQPGFTLTAGSAPVIARICSRLDGIPLAIELAAARLRMLSVEQVANRLDDAFRLLTGGSRTVLPRHQTLRALIDWSYNLLTPPERSLLVSLSVFAGGWTLEAAEAVCATCGAGEQADVFSLLGQLSDKSLVMVVRTENSAPGASSGVRYRLLETIRQYAHEKSTEFPFIQEVRDRHLAYYLDQARLAEPHLRTRDQSTWLNLLDTELDNLRLALDWSLGAHPREGLLLAAALLWFWHIRGHQSEGVDWLERLLEAHPAKDEPALRAAALDTLGFLYHMQYQVQKSRPLYAESLALYRGLGQAGRRGAAAAGLHLAAVGEDAAQSRQMTAESLAVFRDLGDRFQTAEALQNLSGSLLDAGKAHEAAGPLEEDLALRREIGDRDGEGTALQMLGKLAMASGRFDQAQQYFEDGLACYLAVDNGQYANAMVFHLGQLAWVRGDYETASRWVSELAAASQEHNSPTMIANIANIRASIAWSTGDYDQAETSARELLRYSQEEENTLMAASAYYILCKTAISKNNLAAALEDMHILLESGRKAGLSTQDLSIVLETMALIAHIAGQLETAVTLFGAAHHACAWTHYFVSPTHYTERDAHITALREMLSPADFEQAWTAGEALEPMHAVEFGMRSLENPA
jgi:predicted ATPase/class 3 adenylate cyclase